MIQLKYLLVSCLFISTSQTQEIQALRLIGKAELLTNEFVGSSSVDANGEICAAIMVESDLDGFSFDSNNGIVRVDKKAGQSLVYLSSNERVLTVLHSGYKPSRFILASLGIRLKSKAIWKIKITGTNKINILPIGIITNPTADKIYIDGLLKGNVESFQLSQGKHKLKLEKLGYATIEEEIDVSAKNSLFKYEMNELDPIAITISNSPNEAVVYLNGVKEGSTPLNVFKFPNVYDLELRLNTYDVLKTKIAVSQKNNEFTYSLKKNTASLILVREPSTALIHINNRSYKSDTIQLASGIYKIEISEKGFKTKSRTIELSKSDTRIEKFILEAKSGKFQYSVSPVDAKTKLYMKNILVDSWTGLKFFNQLDVAEYTIEVSHKDYHKHIEKITIKENERNIVNVKLSNIPNKETAILLADDYRFGKNGKSINLNKAVELFKIAAVTGNAYSQYSMASIYYSGIKGIKNFREAFKWADKAATQGYYEAQVLLAKLYKEGKGVEQSLFRSLYWENKAKNNTVKESKTRQLE